MNTGQWLSTSLSTLMKRGQWVSKVTKPNILHKPWQHRRRKKASKNSLHLPLVSLFHWWFTHFLRTREASGSFWTINNHLTKLQQPEETKMFPSSYVNVALILNTQQHGQLCREGNTSVSKSGDYNLYKLNSWRILTQIWWSTSDPEHHQTSATLWKNIRYLLETTETRTWSHSPVISMPMFQRDNTATTHHT